MTDVFDRQGLDAAEQFVEENTVDSSTKAALWEELSRLARTVNPQQSIRFLKKALDEKPKPKLAWQLGQLSFRHGHIDLPKEMIKYWTSHTRWKVSDKAKDWLELASGWIDLKFKGISLEPREGPPSYEPEKGSILFCLHNSLSYNSGGYATRSHNILTSLAKRGCTMHVYTRMGYPWDRPENRCQEIPPDFPEKECIDGIWYHRLKKIGYGVGEIPINRYIIYNAEAFKEAATRHRVSIIHAASNYYTGIPAIKAARDLGIPCIYEVRGLWEVTRLSREPSWGETDAFKLYVAMETKAMTNADHVITLTEALKGELINRGVEPNRITVVPNCVDGERFLPRERDLELSEKLGLDDQPVIGYIGTFAEYEGLDDLIRAGKILKVRGVDFRMLLVGDGAMSDEISNIARDTGLTDEIILPGRVPYEEVERYYSLIDVAAFPRKSLPVTEMVSPLKPFEAMAAEKAILVSNVRAMAEFIEEGVNGLIFKKGSIDDMANKLEMIINNKNLRVELGKNARKWVLEHRAWDKATFKVESIYQELDERYNSKVIGR
jgi:glycosyltransferase involved in cell wall biosynthesis